MSRPRRRSNHSTSDEKTPEILGKLDLFRSDHTALRTSILSSIDDHEFDALCQRLHTELNPSNALEDGMARLILSAFERVRQGCRALEQNFPGADRYLKSMLASLRSRLECFNLFRQAIGLNPPTATQPANSKGPTPDPPAAPPNSEAIPAAPETTPDTQEIGEAETADTEDWRSRIAMVPGIDARWPVVDRLGFRVDDILALRDRGVAEEDILDHHPGLTYSELSACYFCELDGYRGPLEPPYPNDLAVIDLESRGG